MAGFKPIGWLIESIKCIHRQHKKSECLMKKWESRILPSSEVQKRKTFEVAQKNCVGRRTSSYLRRESYRQRLKDWLFPHFKKSKEIAEAYAEAKVEKEKSEARKTTEEAAEIAARKDVEKQKEVQAFNTIIDDIFADDGILEAAKFLKLAKLIEKNPEVFAHLDKAKGVIKKLNLIRGVNSGVVDDSRKSLPDSEDEVKEK